MALLPSLWERSPYAVMFGGSMMYIDAVGRGIDDLPTISDHVRRDVAAIYETEGIEGLRMRLRILDPDYLKTADPANHRRLIHAVEICLEAGVPYSTLRTGAIKPRPFRIIKMMIDYQRDELFDRINRRVDRMIEQGLIEEARRVYPMRSLNALNTVGYKELFAWMDGIMDRDTAIARIAKNTRVYAKKQLTWLKRDPSVIRLSPYSALDDALAALGLPT